MKQLICKNLNRTYHQKRPASHFELKDISFQIESGYLTLLIGKNGSGKTSLLQCISGVSPAFLGDVQIEDISLKDSPAEYKQHIGYVSEKLPFFMEKSILDNGLDLGGLFREWSLSDYYSYLDHFDLNPGKRLCELSKGNYMKFQFCFALAHHPDFLLLDEPMAGFDPVFRKDFIRLLSQILDKDTGILMSTHITDELNQAADYVLVLENGRLKAEDSREHLEDLHRKTSAGHFYIKDLI